MPDGGSGQSALFLKILTLSFSERSSAMYTPLYQVLTEENVDQITITRVSVELNPQRFISREELQDFKKNTEVGMIGLKSGAVEVLRNYQGAAVMNKREALRQAEQDKCEAERDDRHKEFMADMNKREALRQVEQDKCRRREMTDRRRLLPI